jgi:Bacterial sugar transferase
MATAVLVIVGRVCRTASSERLGREHGYWNLPSSSVPARWAPCSLLPYGSIASTGLLPVGFLDSFDGVGLSVPILGDARALLPTVQHYNVTKVIVAYGAMDEADMVEILRASDGLEIEIYIVPRFFELGVTTGGKRYDEIWGIPLMRLHRSAVRAAARRSKRMFDIVVAMVAHLLASPIFLATALAVHLSTPGPIFLRQRRVGKDGREFELLKFRSMVVNKHSDTSWLAADDYMTPVGRILRRTSLDELPQLLNVLRGDMSLVGPRPERPYFVNQSRPMSTDM